MATGDTQTEEARLREETELLRAKVKSDRILLPARNIKLLFLQQPCEHYPGRIWTQGLPDFALVEQDGIAPFWGEPPGEYIGQTRCRTEEGGDLAIYGIFLDAYGSRKENFQQHAAAIGQLLLAEAVVPGFEFIKELFEFCRLNKRLNWESNEQPGHPETRRRPAWLFDVYEAIGLFLNAQLKSQEQATEAADGDSGKLVARASTARIETTLPEPNGEGVPCLVVILERLGWRVFKNRCRRKRREYQIEEAKKKNQPTTALETQREELKGDLARYVDLLNDCAEWIRVRTGIPIDKLVEVATSTAFIEGKDRDDIYAKLGTLDERGLTAELWKRLLSEDRDALVSVGLLPSPEPSPPASEAVGHDSEANRGTSSQLTAKAQATVDDGGSNPGAIVTTLNSMRRLSNGWRFDWQDSNGAEGGEVNDLKGFDYIAQLIGTPHVSIPTVRLLGIESDPIALSDKRYPQPAWDSATERDVDAKEADLEANVTRLHNECNEAKAESDDVAYGESNTLREQAWNELLKLRRVKAGATKPNGQSRELNKPNAKQHENVRGAIRRAVEHLDAKNLKRLALHFGDFAKPDGTGMGYVYCCPDPTVTWNVEKATPTG